MLQQIIFDAPYNRQMRLPRMFHWRDWRNFVYPMLGKCIPSEIITSSYDEVEGKTTLEPYQRPNQILIPGKGIRRNTSFSSVHSGMSAEEVQSKYDLYQSIDTPLNIEDIATIITGSVSLVDHTDFVEEEENRYHNDLISVKDRKEKQPITNQLRSSADLLMKKKALHEKLLEKSDRYKKEKHLREKKMAIEQADSME
jgi:hypothetical protein